MPRKAFLADFETAKVQRIRGITSVSRGENDEDINVCFVPPVGAPIEITLLTQPGTFLSLVFDTCSCYIL
jgi:ubiquitin-conjugating enzyme E2 Q